MAPQKRKTAPTKDESNPVKKRGRGQPTSKKGKISGPSEEVIHVPTAEEGSDNTASKGSAAKGKITKAKPASKSAKGKITKTKTAGKIAKGTDKSEVVKSATRTGKKLKDTASERPLSSTSAQISGSKKAVKKDEAQEPHEPSYWLMKAEPESRIERGKDVKFSIDDLKNALAPEPWDGKR